MNAVVVGGGVAGVVAALELAQGGARTIVVRAGGGATALGGGTLDAAAAPLRTGAFRGPDGAPKTPRQHLATILEHAPAHPYRRLLGGRREPGGEEKDALAAGRRQLDRALAGAGLATAGHLETSLWLLDTSGALRVTDCAIQSVARGCLRTGEGCEELAVPLLPGLEGWDAAALARRVGGELHALGEPGRPVHLCGAPLAGALRDFGGSPARWARRLEEPDAPGALAEALAPELGPGRLLLMPPILGIDEHARVLEEFERELTRRGAGGCGLAELVGTPPFHLMGTRIERALRNALDAADIATIEGRVQPIRGRAGRISRVEFERVDGAQASMPAATVVLATGRFVAGGLRAERAGLEEPLLGLPLYDAQRRRCDGAAPRELTSQDYRAPQPLYEAGVLTDATLRPLEATGVPAFENLFAAGDLLGGFDPARDRNGYGVALASGFRAARAALEHLAAEGLVGS